eukprot:361758-Chlamydomonas_euryale.AAC.9
MACWYARGCLPLSIHAKPNSAQVAAGRASGRASMCKCQNAKVNDGGSNAQPHGWVTCLRSCQACNDAEMQSCGAREAAGDSLVAPHTRPSLPPPPPPPPACSAQHDGSAARPVPPA